MEPKVLSSDTLQGTARSRSRLWLPGILLALVILITLFAMRARPAAQEEPKASWQTRGPPSSARHPAWCAAMG